MRSKLMKPEKRCKACRTVLERAMYEEVCDECKGTLLDDWLTVAVFFADDSKDACDLVFCSWDCTLKNLSKRRGDDYFTVLPYVHHDVKGKTGAKSFWKAVREFGRKQR